MSCADRGIARSKNVGRTDMASAEREPITGLGQRDPGAAPPKAKNLLAFGCTAEAANLLNSPYFANSLNFRYL